MADQPLPFSLDWLAEAARLKKPLSVCADGHLVVRASHWRPVQFTGDLHAILCEPADHPAATDPTGKAVTVANISDCDD